MANRSGFGRGCRLGCGMYFGAIAATVLLPVLFYVAIGILGIFSTPSDQQQKQNPSPSQTQ